MVFSIFKKPDEKMPTRPAAKPRTPVAAPAPAAGAPQSAPAAARGELSQPPATFDDDLESLDFTGIQIEESLDPLDAALEQAAIDFANDDDVSAATVLGEQLQMAGASAKCERVWLMLFDLHRVTGNREAFIALELDYARRFEKQPPVWQEADAETVAAARGGAATPFKGELVGSNGAGFAQLQQIFEGNPKARVDLAKVKVADVPGCEQLLAFLAQVRKKKGQIELLGLESLATVLAARVAEQAGEQVFWRVLLECYQRLGRQEDFDNLAVDFAVAFEISPPSWEPLSAPAKTAPAKPAAPKLAEPAAASGDAFVLRGDVRGGRLDGLDAYLGSHEAAVIDMAAVTRMDFTSAGSLLNALSPLWQRGISITLRHPNRLVAELLHVVGVSAMVTVVFAKS